MRQTLPKSSSLDQSLIRIVAIVLATTVQLVLASPLHAQTRILFCSDKATGSSQRWELYTMNEDGTDLQRVTTTTRSEWTPALAPDNHTIAFIDNLNTGASNLWLTNLDGDDATNIAITNRAMSVQWADEDTLYYLADIPGGSLQRFQIWQVETNGTSQQVVYDTLFDIFPTGSDSFQFHRGLDRLYFSARIPASSPSVPYSGIPTGTTFDIEFNPCDDPDFPPKGPELDDHYDVAVSPHGTLMAYAADFFDGNHRMYVRNSNGDCSTQLRLSSGFTGDPDWSPDSQWIAFTRSTSSTLGRGPYIGDIYTARADGSTLDNLTGSLLSVSNRCAHPLVYQITLNPIPLPISSLTRTPGASTVLTWQTVPGFLYQIEYGDALTNWLSNLPNSSLLAGKNTPTPNYTDETTGGTTMRFYRIVSGKP